jgi:hypothetical protein
MRTHASHGSFVTTLEGMLKYGQITFFACGDGGGIPAVVVSTGVL